MKRKEGDGQLLGTYCVRCVCPCVGKRVWEDELPWEPAGYGEIAMGSVSSCSLF